MIRPLERHFITKRLSNAKTQRIEDAKDFFLYAFCPFAYFALKIFDEFCLKGTGLPVAVFVNYSTILA
jgi:hypothetical protein